MFRHLFCAAKRLALCGLIASVLSSGIVVAETRLGGEDVRYSYSHVTDQVAFGGSERGVEVHTGFEPSPVILWIQDLRTGSKRRILDIRNAEIGRLALAPSGTMIAAQLYLNQGGQSLNPKLSVLTAEGQEIIAFSQSHDFAWSPDSRFLAYTAGEWVGRYTFHSTGTWLYDLALKTGKQIADQGDFVAWSQSDNSLYILDRSRGLSHVLRYDPRTQKSMDTNRQGIFFSPTGRYYHSAIPRFNQGGVEVYDAQSNQPILRQRPRLESVLPSARIVGWASEGDVLILEVNRQDLVSDALPDGRLDTVLYDVAHNIARIVEDDSVIGWQNGSAILHAKGKFTKRPLGTIPILPEQAAKPLKLPPSDHLKTQEPPPQ